MSGGFHFLSALISREGFIFTSTLCNTVPKKALAVMNTAVGEERKERGKLLLYSEILSALSFVSLFLFSSCLPHNISLKSRSNETVNLLKFIMKGHFLLQEKKQKSTSLVAPICLYSSILSASRLSTPLPISFSLTQITSFFSEIHFSLDGYTKHRRLLI